MEKKTLRFEADATQIDIKSILKKEFVELRMRAISTANPNRNNSWFTKESLVNSKDTFKNKPILGYFENGDFVSHNGEWKQDPDTKLDYWDTAEVKKGERPLGVIREQDEVEVVDDPNTGLSWIVLSCVLWTQYSFKQVKRLLKDAKRAKQSDGTTKNISVEVDITDYEVLDNGVIKINAFNLVGITILGSRNGVKVEPGIEGAELSVVDIMGTSAYEKDMQNLRLAYEKLDGSDISKKEEDSDMFDENDENVVTPTDDSSSQANFEGNAQVPADNTEPTNDDNVEPTATPDPVTEPVTDPVTEPVEPIHQDHEAGEPTNSDEPVQAEPEAGEPQSEPAQEPANDPEPAQEPIHQNEENQTQVQDMTWLLERISGFAGCLKCTLDYYATYPDLDGNEYILPVLKRVYKQTVANEQELAGLLAKVAEGIKPEEQEMAVALEENCDCKAQYEAYNALKAQFDAVNTELNAVKAKIEEAEKAEAHKKFMKEAKATIKTAKFSDEIALSFEKDCEEGKITTLDELKTQIGLKLYELTSAQAPVENKPAEAFDAPVTTPDVTSFTGDTGKKEKKDKWETLRENNRK